MEQAAVDVDKKAHLTYVLFNKYGDPKGAFRMPLFGLVLSSLKREDDGSYTSVEDGLPSITTTAQLDLYMTSGDFVIGITDSSIKEAASKACVHPRVINAKNLLSLYTGE